VPGSRLYVVTFEAGSPIVADGRIDGYSPQELVVFFGRYFRLGRITTAGYINSSGIGQTSIRFVAERK
jgi:hypothetical protein